MPRVLRPLVLAVLAAGLPAATQLCAEEPAPPTAAAPPAMFDQTDSKKMMSIKLPREFKSATGEHADPEAIITFRGTFGPDPNRPGLVTFTVANQYARASLARAQLLPLQGESIRAESLRQGPGWFEGCAVSVQKQSEWRRYVEKGGRVYVFRVAALDAQYDLLHADVQKLLDTATVPGEFAPKAPGEGFTPRKGGEFDVVSDADADRAKSIEKACATLAAGRDVVVKLLPGKPFDAAKPVAWIYQNKQKFEDRAKAATAKSPERAIFNPPERCAMVSILGENTNGQTEAVTLAGADQYVWQYFGGTAPIWVQLGLARYGQLMVLGPGKGKLAPDDLTKVKTAVGQGKRRLDEWFDVVKMNEVTDAEQAALELFAWHSYFRVGKGAKKFKKQYDACLQSLRDTGDPAAAKKAFGEANFTEMLAEFKSWVADWK